MYGERSSVFRRSSVLKKVPTTHSSVLGAEPVVRRSPLSRWTDSLGGKTGTGDNQFKVHDGGGYPISSHAVNRTAAFAFLVGDRFFGTILACVPGKSAEDYEFTSSLAVQNIQGSGANYQATGGTGKGIKRMRIETDNASSLRRSNLWTKMDQPTEHMRSNLSIEPASVRFLTGLEKSDTKVILAAANRRKFKAGEIVARAEDPASQMFLVKDGYVDFYVGTSDGREILLRRLVSGNIFGVAAFLSEPIGYVGTSKSVGDSEVYVWGHTVIRQLAKAHPRLAENALRTVLRYVALFAERHLALVSKPAQERLAFALTSLGSRAGHLVPSGVEINIKNEELAALADVSSFTASRFLQEWERKGAVEKGRGKVLIRCPEKLLA
jgi:CRP-like cAMP-binding protein